MRGPDGGGLAGSCVWPPGFHRQAFVDHPVDHPDDPTGSFWIRLEVVEMRRTAAILVLLLAAAVWPAAGGLDHRSASAQAAAAEGLRADFNNDGSADLAVWGCRSRIWAPPATPVP
jgi:hypothetical protein